MKVPSDQSSLNEPENVLIGLKLNLPKGPPNTPCPSPLRPYARGSITSHDGLPPNTPSVKYLPANFPSAKLPLKAKMQPLEREPLDSLSPVSNAVELRQTGITNIGRAATICLIVDARYAASSQVVLLGGTGNIIERETDGTIRSPFLLFLTERRTKVLGMRDKVLGNNLMRHEQRYELIGECDIGSEDIFCPESTARKAVAFWSAVSIEEDVEEQIPLDRRTSTSGSRWTGTMMGQQGRRQLLTALLLLQATARFGPVVQAASADSTQAAPSVAPSGLSGPDYTGPSAGSDECDPEMVGFELVTGYVYTAPTDMLESIPGTLMLTDCLETCQANDSCQAVNYETGLCVLFSSNADSNPGALSQSQFPVFTIYAQKSCLAVKPCERAWCIDRVQGHRLQGHTRRTMTASSRQHCLELCLGERDFLCRARIREPSVHVHTLRASKAKGLCQLGSPVRPPAPYLGSDLRQGREVLAQAEPYQNWQSCMSREYPQPGAVKRRSSSGICGECDEDYFKRYAYRKPHGLKPTTISSLDYLTTEAFENETYNRTDGQTSRYSCVFRERLKRRRDAKEHGISTALCPLDGGHGGKLNSVSVNRRKTAGSGVDIHKRPEEGTGATTFNAMHASKFPCRASGLAPQKIQENKRNAGTQESVSSGKARIKFHPAPGRSRI
ncbi:hypothetical protein KM043_010889 [Ampulex compressa]|nr:hypothetical protein KM043_010889 [Ampulex compressa]